MGIKLLDSVDANTTGATFNTDGSAKVLTVEATSFGGGAVSIELSRNGGATFIPLQKNDVDIAITANTVSQKLDHLAQGLKIRAVLSGATPGNLGVIVEIF